MTKTLARAALRLAAGIAVAALAAPAAPGAEPKDGRTIEEKVRDLEARQEKARKALEELTRELAAVRKEMDETSAAGQPAASRPTGPVEPKGLTPLDVGSTGSTGQVTSGTSFNPSISVIPEGIYYNDDRSGGALGLMLEADGFAGTPAGEGRDLKRGFNLGETEFTFSGAVDPYFDVTAIASLSGDGISLEEAYVRTRRFPAGLALKVGKFYSALGYANRQHPHQWDFVDQSLPYAMLLGGAVNDVGVQLTCLPKTPFYLQVGVEALQGENPGVANVLGPGVDPALSDDAGPRLFTGFAKVAPNVGLDDALQIGVSGGYSSQHQEETATGFAQGTAWFAGTDWVFKHDASGTGGKGSFVLSAEYLYREKELDVAASPDEASVGTPWRAKQDGLTVQGVWGFVPRWTLNLRYDTVGVFTNDVARGLLGSASYDASRRISAAVTFNPTEFSRIRAQVNRGDAPVGGEHQRFVQFFLQYQLSLGVHGAHTF